MGGDIEESWFIKLVEDLETFCNKVDDKVEKQELQLKASKKKTEFDLKLAHEMKTNSELKEKLAKLNKQGSELDRICSTFDSRLTIADRDQQRLETAKEMYQIAKELTGVRLDFSATQNVAKGYVKNSTRKILNTFEMDSKQAADGALWDVISNCSDKENLRPYRNL